LAQRRRAEPYGAQRVAAVDMHKDWLPNQVFWLSSIATKIVPLWSAMGVQMFGACI